MTDRFQYGPYGEPIAHTGSTDTPFQFNGRYGVQTDLNGLLYMRARYYDPTIRRFINQDATLGSIIQGTTLNRFAFANGNPVSLLDPFGLCAQDDQSDAFGNPTTLQGWQKSWNDLMTGWSAYLAWTQQNTAWFQQNMPWLVSAMDGIEEGSKYSMGEVGALEAFGAAEGPGLFGVTNGEASSLARQIYGIKVNGEPAVSSIEAFGSRAGSTFRGRGPLPSSDLDIIVTLNKGAANPAGLAIVNSELGEIGTMFHGAKGFPVNPIVEIPGLPSVKPNLLQTPFIPLKQ